MRRNVISAIVMMLAALAPCREAPAQQTETIESVRTRYANMRLGIYSACSDREKAALAQYARNLDAMLAAQKQKGDLDTYMTVETEKKRFASDGNLPSNAAPVLAAPIEVCQKTFADAAARRNRQTVLLLNKYVVELNSVVKQLMRADKIEEAKKVKTEQNKVDIELADLQAQIAKETKAVAKAKERPNTVSRKAVPGDAKEFKGHHYLFVADKKKWLDAKTACENAGGHLVTITTKEENAFAFKLTDGQNTWIGCTDEAKEGEWKWVTGENFSFLNWSKAQPDNHKGAENYGHFWSKTPSLWNDVSDSYFGPLCYICEWDY